MPVARRLLSALGLALVVAGLVAAGLPVAASAQAPNVSGVSISSNAGVDSTYAATDVIGVEVRFDQSVDVTGTPQLALTIGAATQQANYASGTGTSTLTFRYTVATTDVDADGISIGASALALNSGTIQIAGGATAANLGLGTHAISNATAHKVQGDVPAVASVWFLHPTRGVQILLANLEQADSVYGVGDRIRVAVRFSRDVRGSGTPQLALNIGSQTRSAPLCNSVASFLIFCYTVVAADSDSDGLSIGANALTLPGGARVVAAGTTTNADLSLADHQVTNNVAFKVDGTKVTPPVVSAVEYITEHGAVMTQAAADSTFGLEDVIRVKVTFDRSISWHTQWPRLALTIGANTRTATFYAFTAHSLYFNYTVVAADRDSTGISIGANALTIPGGAIRRHGTSTNAILSLAAHDNTDNAAFKVDGTKEVAPNVSGVSISSDPGADSAYAEGNTIEVKVDFDRPVDVTGTPQVALGIGTQTRQADYAAGTGTKSLRFRYAVVVADADADGISIGASALALNGGTIELKGGSANANLGLGGHAISNATGHKVTGDVPYVTTIFFANPQGVQIFHAGTDSVYGSGDVVRVIVGFNTNIRIASTTQTQAQLALGIGTQTRQAPLCGQNVRFAFFCYTVVAADVDADGISIGANALTFPAGSGAYIRRQGTTTDANVSLADHTFTNNVAYKVDGTVEVAPNVSGVTISSDPGADSAYAEDNTIEVKVDFDRPVDVTGTPRVALGIDTLTRQADYAAGSGTKSLRFRYTVVLTDSDANGISIGASALALNGGTIRIAGGTTAANLGLGTNAISNASGHKVTGDVPYVTAMFFVTPLGVQKFFASTDSVFGLGDQIWVAVGFNTNVDILTTQTQHAELALGIGTQTRQAPGCARAARFALFCYTVVAADMDSDGISIGANALTFPTGSGAYIRRQGTTTDANVSLAGFEVTNDIAFQVDGAQEAAPNVSGVTISSDAGADSTYGASDTIEVKVDFDRPVDATGTPQVALGIGTQTRQAGYAAGTGTRSLRFRYTVVLTDSDSDGLSIGASALALNGGTIEIAGGSAVANLGLGSHAIANAAAHKVNGAQAVPHVTGTVIASDAGNDSTYASGDTIEVGLVFNENVDVTGTPQLALGIGSAVKQAGYATGTGGDSLVFRYVVAPGDEDVDGLSVSAGALALNGGTIRRAGSATVNAYLGLQVHTIANAAAHKVLGGPPTVSGVFFVTPANTGLTYASTDSVFGLGDEIRAAVSFGVAVTATGTPRLALGIGTQTRSAVLCDTTGANVLVFCYTVVAADSDSDGISVGANALTLPGGATLRATGSTTGANLSLAPWNFANSALFQVDGTKEVAPGVSGVAIASDAGTDSTYHRFEAIRVEVAFDRAVDVVGTPQLALGIGAATRQAGYASGTGTSTLTFQYSVGPSDSDADGVSIGTSALALNGGTIEIAGGSAAAALGLGSHAIANAAAHKVAGDRPVVTGVSLGSPVTGDVFERGDTIEARVSFGRWVTVTGTPQLALTIGTATRQASYASGSGSGSLAFRYVVASGDADADGLSVGAGALGLNGGTIAVTGGTANALLELQTWHVITNSAGHKVDGGTLTAASVSGVSVASVPSGGDTYLLGDTIDVAVAFTRLVAVTGTPQLAIGIGSSTRQASYASGTGTDTLLFRYAVVAADADTNGLSIGAGALGLNGGTVADARDVSVAAGLGLGSSAVSNSTGHKVDGSRVRPARVLSVTLNTVPPTSQWNQFVAGDWMQVTVEFSAAVDVVGTPQVAIVIGTATRQAAYASGTGTATLVFRYQMHGYDPRDDDGIGVARDALALNGGTIRRAGSSDAALLDFGRAYTGTATNPTHRAGVSGIAVSSPGSGGTYGVGETIEVTVSLSHTAVLVSGAGPQLALGIGTQTRQASMVLGGGNTYNPLRFRYVVQAADADADGISIAANAITGGNVQSQHSVRPPFWGLGRLAIANDGMRKVDGSLGAVVSGLSIGSPPSGDVFERGDAIEVAVAFNRAVDVAGTPQLALAVDTLTRQASYASGTGTDTLVFRYVVVAADADTLGISIAANALSLNGGTIRQAGGTTNAVLGLGGHAVTNSSGHKVDGGTLTAASVSGVAITSAPSSDSTYGRTERIEVAVEFVRAVTVTGTPQLALGIGTATRQAAYASGSGTRTLVFRYVVVAADADSTGISIGASALALNGGAINDARDGTAAASLGLGSHAVANDRSHKVNGSLGPPGVASLSIGSPVAGTTFERGETIEVSVVFSRPVDVGGTPQLALGIGSATRQADYASGTGTDTLVFRYVVAAGDADADGISIAASALALSGGTIKVAGGVLDATLGLGAGVVVTNSAGHKVAGGTFTTPSVSAVTVSSAPASASTYQLGESIEVKVAFSRPVAVTGTPRLALGIGTATRQADYDSASSSADTLVFGYAVRPTDVDADGLSIAAGALALNGGTINDARPGATAASLDLGSNAITNAASHKVNGGLGPPGVTGLAVAPPPAGAVFERGDTIVATVRFNKAVDVTGTPQLALGIGAQTRQAAYASGTGTAALVFRYVVATADADADGLSVGASALALNGGTIDVAGGTTDALLSLERHAIGNDGALRVSGATFTASSVSGVSISSSPASDSTYGRTERIEVEVTFDRNVAVTGTPQLALTIGDSTRQASYASGSGTKTLAFGYVVVAADSDANGLSVGPAALALNGGAIDDARDASEAAGLGLGSHAISNALAHKVNGSLGPPGVTGVTLGSPPVGTTFERGDTIVATLAFNRAVAVTGAPQLALGIGSATKQAVYASGSGTSSLEFRYVVVTADVDADGLSVATTALGLNGGTVRLAGGTLDATLGLGTHAISNSAGHKVAGGTFTASGVTGVAVASSPASGATYGLGERIEVRVTFARAVAVTGTPQLALSFGAATRQADYAGGTGTPQLSFGYVVVAGDADSDGLSIGASALALNGGTIADGRDGSTAAALGLGSSAVADAAGHRVDATRGPPGVMGVTIGSPQVGDTFERGDTVEVEVEFNKPVAVTGAPQLALGIGAATKQAGYAGGSGTAALAFRYVVVSADADADGISVAAGALALNGGTIKVSGGTADALLGLGAHAVANSAGHKVAGGTFTASSPSAASVTSAPASGDTYGLSERIEVRVTFARPVVVTGAPQLALGIGAATKQAGYAGGSGTRALVFGYVVASADADADGISVGASALSLNGGAIADARDGSTAAGLGLGSSAIANAGAHKVDGSVEGAPAVAGARLASAPSGGGSYGLGEEIRVAVRFDRAVAVTGTPELALGIGAATRQAGYASGSGTSELEFAYVVQAADADRDGISVGAGALSLSGGTLVVAGGTAAAVLSLGSHAIVNASGHAVAGTLEAAPVVTGARLVSSPANGSAYGLSERIAVALAFSRPVDVAGAPQLALGIGSATRQAGYASGSGTAELVFGYVVAGGDADADGVSVAAGALALNGGTIVIAGGRVAAVLSLGTHALSNVAGHLVDGSAETAPAVAGVTLASAPIGGGRYELGEEIRVHVRFDRAVAVTGSPQLALTIGAQTRTARFVRVVGYGAAARAGWAGVAAGYAGARWAGGSAGGAGGSAGALGATQGAALEFAYAVQAADADADGLSVGAGALSLNGGAITLLGGTAAAGLSLGGHALTNVGGHLVDGSVVSPPAVAGVEASRPQSGGRWRAGQTIEIAVVFDRPVSVTGGPRLALAMGTRTVHAALASASGRRVEFAYEVRPHDRAPNGIALAAGALDASGAAIVSAADGSTPAALSLGSHAFASDPTRRVEGGGGEPEPGRPPKFGAESYAFELAENVAGAVVVGAVSAVDPDEGDEVYYRLREGGGGLFEVDETSGEVSYVGAGEDYEAGPREHALVVSAADVGGLASTVRVTVKVTNANEAPAFERASWTFELAENAAGPIVLGTVSATDPDEGEALSYSLVSGGGGLFELDASSGAVRYVGAGEDYETGPREHALAVAVADAGGLRAAAGVVIAVADADEAPVFEQASWTFELAENAAGPVVLGTVSATDPDEGEALSYSLVSGGGGLFELDASSGAVSYVGAGEDYETGPREHALVVAATGADGLAAQAAVVVTVADVNEAPVFEQASWTFELAENAAGPLAVGAVAAADEDEGDVLSYSLVSDGGGLFELDASSGAVRYVGAGEDYETGPREHALVVAATDRGGLAATANATVVVTDVNEAPEATAQIAVAALDAHGAAVQETLDAYFRDPDGDALAYAAESSDTAVAAASVAGGVLTIQPFAIGTASVTVTATDPGGLAAEQTVAVVVEASRSERARVLEGALAAFGRSLGAEAVDVIGGRLGIESAGGLGRSHLQLGGRAVGCDGGFAQRAEDRVGAAGAAAQAGAGAETGARACGWQALARAASGLLGVQVALPSAGGLGGAPSAGALDPAALLFGGPGAGAGGLGGPAGGGLGMGGDYRGQQEPAAATPGGVTLNPLSGGDLLERSSFQLSLGGGAASDSGAFGAQDAAGLRPGWTVWGRAGMGGYEGRPADGLRFDGGRARSAHLGADYRFASGLLVGVAGARSSFETEFESAVNGAGSVAASLTSVHPYVHWSPTGGLGLWALAGAGTGDATLEETAGGRFGADIAMLMGALGARRELAGGIALKADAFSVRVRSDDAADLAGVTARAHRVRLAPEVAKTWALGGEASLRTRLELGARLDAGDAETGLGAEAGGEASFDHAPTGLSVAMRGRALLAHQAEGLREWGAGVSLRLQPGGGAEDGLSLSVEPAWGAGAGATGELWRQGAAALEPAVQTAPTAAPSGWAPGRMAMELGWGVALDNGATITPFGRWSQDAGAGQRFNAGARFSLLGPSAQSGTGVHSPADPAQSLRFLLHLYGEHASSPLEPPQRRLGIAGAIQLR